MKNLIFGCTLLTALSCPGIGANQETSDNLTPVYNAITKNVLPGISVFIDALVEKDSNDFSDHWFISRAKCAYTSWAFQVNQKIVLDQDQPNDIRLNPEDKDRQKSTITDTENCRDLPDITGHKLPDLSELKHLSSESPIPIEGFIAVAEESFSSLGSYVQQMPSYQSINLFEDAPSNTYKRRIILETVLYLLGQVTKDAPDGSWSKQYGSSFRQAMRPFHCSRFITQENRDSTQNSDCLQKQSNSDIQRSNQATSLTEIALGEFLPAGYNNLNSLESYGYQPGLAFAGSYEVSSQRRNKYMSSIVETILLALLMRRIGG
ncbi:hypothetical protein [Endozoicomonas euniceicola]|uniref:Uncharacterized protein n=1 Tax=Endozoicomonas euniceicola TaxID=1234143 RepID=A0ABY6GTN9_9GAMM|nr:hypothetical protein [Endozoicomonas euniceicola]UYM16146.1 hypothetical protein NX720_25660 [Endozoicomonas euniceicola]